jgi:thiosulfate dehydrogenase (quinone) large subunit
METADRRSADRQIAYTLLRLLLGVNIAVHGISRMLAGAGTFAVETTAQFARTPLPAWSVHTYALVLPFAEAVVGLLVFLGLGTRWALVAGQLLMLSLTLGSALKQDWNAAGWQLLYGLVYTALLAFVEYNGLSVDSLLRRREIL